MKITVTLVNYYFHCKRQCWLFAHRINLEDNSEDVRIGRVMHEIKSDKGKKTEISIENVKIDKITEDYLVEIKKSDADIEAVKWQTFLYLKILKDKGIEKRGRIEFIEKNKQDKKVIYVDLTNNEEAALEQLTIEINNLVDQKKPPDVINKSKCKKCAYYEYCYI